MMSRGVGVGARYIVPLHLLRWSGNEMNRSAGLSEGAK
jgi:hypothetical protein